MFISKPVTVYMFWQLCLANCIINSYMILLTTERLLLRGSSFTPNSNRNIKLSKYNMSVYFLPFQLKYTIDSDFYVFK